MIDGFGFKSIDYSLLNDDGLYFLRQLEIEPQRKEHYLQVCEPMKDGDLVPAFKQIFQERVEQGNSGSKVVVLEWLEPLYERCVKLRQQLMQIIRDTQTRVGN